MFSKLAIRTRILILLATIAIVAAGISSYVGFYIARKSLEEQAFSKLTAMREMKTVKLHLLRHRFSTVPGKLVCWCSKCR